MTNDDPYGDLPKLSQKIRERKGRLAGHCFRNKNEPVSTLIHWIPKHERRKSGRHPPFPLHVCRCPQVRHWTGDIEDTDSNAGQEVLEGHSSSRTPLDISLVSQVKCSCHKIYRADEVGLFLSECCEKLQFFYDHFEFGAIS